jgi:signal transduction histidine kinase/ActR/RegA family two-component response regulator
MGRRGARRREAKIPICWTTFASLGTFPPMRRAGTAVAEGKQPEQGVLRDTTMTTDARVIRSERFEEIGTIIRRDSTLLIDRWASRAVLEQPNAQRVHHDVLLDHLPTFLHELANSLAEAGDPAYCVARRHGQQRWETGWSLEEVIRDYRILRLVLLEYLDECLDRPLELLEVQAVGFSLDEAIEASIERYVHGRNEQLAQLEATLRKQSEALRTVEVRKNEFLATLAHELRSPLAPLRNSLDILRLSGEAAANLTPLREMMDRQVQQMTRLVDDLFDVSRIAQGKLELKRSRLDLRPILEQAVQMNAPLMEARKHRLSIQLPDERLPVEADQVRLVQVFVNLLNNAAKYTPEGGEVSLAAAAEGGETVVRVKDNGVGIAAEMLPHIFELFTQLSVGGEKPQGGLGIGLALVRRLVELHGGSITAISHGIGQGCEFVVRLPLAAGVEEAPGQPETRGKTSAGRHILVIEDNRDGRESLAMLLRLLGHRLDLAEDGAKGVAAALALKPEVALIDIGLPGLDGYQVAGQIRAALGKDVFLVALTGFSQPEDRQRATEAGFDAYLVKPVELDALRALLDAPGSFRTLRP